MKTPLTVKELNKLLKCCDQDSIAVMMVGDELKYIYSVDEDEAIGNDDIYLISDYCDVQHMQSCLLGNEEHFLDFYNVSVLN